MQKRILLIAGSPGVGKTTVLLKTTDILKTKGLIVGGMLSREVRSGRTRIGFEVTDLYTGETGWLAHTDLKCGPRVGKYHVNLADLESVGAESVRKANEECDIVAVDEVGPMELFSKKFSQALRDAVDSRKPVIATIHWKAENELIKEIRTREDTEIFVVASENRDRLPPAIAGKVGEYLAATRLE